MAECRLGPGMIRLVDRGPGLGGERQSEWPALSPLFVEKASQDMADGSHCLSRVVTTSFIVLVVLYRVAHPVALGQNGRAARA